MTTQPRGIRNNNPGNIRWGDPWQGLVPTAKRTDRAFCQFTKPTFGIRALARVLINYKDKHNISTIREVISRWAPPNENNTDAYISAVAAKVGIYENTVIDLHEYKILKPIVEAIIHHENGTGGKKTPNTWYDDATIDEGLRLAGVVQEAATVPATKVPVTKETVGATVLGGTGLGQLADVAPTVVQALDKAETHLTSGQLMRVVFGIVTVAIAVFIAYSQWQKNRRGVL